MVIKQSSPIRIEPIALRCQGKHTISAATGVLLEQLSTIVNPNWMVFSPWYVHAFSLALLLTSFCSTHYPPHSSFAFPCSSFPLTLLASTHHLLIFSTHHHLNPCNHTPFSDYPLISSHVLPSLLTHLCFPITLLSVCS